MNLIVDEGKVYLNALTKYRSFTNKLISMKEYLKEMLKIILNSQVSKKNNLHYSNELGQKLRECTSACTSVMFT